MALFDFLLQVKCLLNTTIRLKSHVSKHRISRKSNFSVFNFFFNGEERYLHGLKLFLVISYD